jgi:hypothetical protein
MMTASAIATEVTQHAEFDLRRCVDKDLVARHLVSGRLPLVGIFKQSVQESITIELSIEIDDGPVDRLDRVRSQAMPARSLEETE